MRGDIWHVQVVQQKSLSLTTETLSFASKFPPQRMLRCKTRRSGKMVCRTATVTIVGICIVSLAARVYRRPNRKTAECCGYNIILCCTNTDDGVADLQRILKTKNLTQAHLQCYFRTNTENHFFIFFSFFSVFLCF